MLTRRFVFAALASISLAAAGCGGGGGSKTRPVKSPVPGDDVLAVPEDGSATTADVLANDTDPDADPLTVVGHTAPAHGTVLDNGNATFTYTPAPDYVGTDSFEYIVSDGTGGIARGTVHVTVDTPNNDAPLAADDALTTDEDTPGTTGAVTAGDVDPDGDALSITAFTQPVHGTVTQDNDTFTYTPDANFHGADLFTYTVSDGNGESAVGTVRVFVSSINDAPTTAAGAVGLPEDAAAAPGNVLDFATDVDGDGLTVALVTPPASGTLDLAPDGSFTYTPAADFHGTVSFAYTVTDGIIGTPVPGSVDLEVAPVNDLPVPVADAHLAQRAGSTVTANVIANDTDVDGDTLSVVSWTDGTHGSVAYQGGGIFTYTPDGYVDSGTDSFTYTVSDGAGGTVAGTVGVTIAQGWSGALTHDETSNVGTATDPSGNIYLVRSVVTDGKHDFRVSRFDPVTPEWSAPQTLDLLDGAIFIASDPLVDGNGNLTVFWLQSGEVFNDLWTARRDASTGSWSTATKVDTVDTGSVVSPLAVVDAAGNVTVMWGQFDGAARNDMWAARMSASGTWGTAERIESDDTGTVNAFAKRLLVDGNGTVTTVWLTSVGGQTDITANRLTGGTWGTAQKIDTEDLGPVFGMEPALDSNGNVTLVWTQYDGVRSNVWARRMTAAGVWGTAQRIETEDLGGATSLRIFLGANDRLTAVWLQLDGSRFNAWANSMSSAGSWGTALKIASEDLTSTDVVGILDAGSRLTVVIRQHDGSRYNLWANRMSAAGTWGTTEKIESEDLGSAFVPSSLVLDANGNVTTVWTQSDGTVSNLWANRFGILTGTWGTPQKIETEDLGGIINPSVLVNGAGHVTVAWQQYDGTRYSLWSNRHDGSSWGTAAKIETGDGNIPQFQTVLDGDDVVAVWAQRVPGETIRFHSNRLFASSGSWQGPLSPDIGLPPGGVVNLTTLTVDGSGAPVCVGRSLDGAVSRLWTTDYR